MNIKRMAAIAAGLSIISAFPAADSLFCRPDVVVRIVEAAQKAAGQPLSEEAFERENVFGKGQDNTAYARYFVGNSYLNPLVKPGETPIFLANVTFEPGCRNNWHIHHAKQGGGQMLVCTAGQGWYQAEGQAPVSLTPGSVVYIPAGVKHWHGAKADSWFSHISVEVPGEDTSNEWLQPVSDKEYKKLPLAGAARTEIAGGDGMKIMDEKEFDKVNVFGKGKDNTAYAQYFVGNSYLNPLVEPGKAPIFLANVTFEPGCRNNWHIHHAKKGGGQMLICTAGQGWYQAEGQAPVSLTPGSVVYIPAGVKHWHGAKADSWFSHISVEVPGEDTSNEWLEPVNAEEYGKLR